MFETNIYIVWRSSKGSKDIYAIFADPINAKHNASIWQEESDRTGGIKQNFRVEKKICYSESYPAILTFDK